MPTHKPADDFGKHELAAFREFRRSGDVLGMLSLADHCDETGEGGYAAMLRLVCDPPNMYRDLRDDTFEKVRWFLQCWCNGPPGAGVFRDAARLAWAECHAIRMELTGCWRFSWTPCPFDQYTHWACTLEEWTRRPKTVRSGPPYLWAVIESLVGIYLGWNGRAPACPIPEILWGTPYGPDPYCRVVMAQMAESHTDFPEELTLASDATPRDP